MFKKPVWTFELIRDTDAPFERVLAALLDGPRYGAWHPAYASAAPHLGSQEGGRAEVVVQGSPFPGVIELAHFIFPFFAPEPYGYFPGMVTLVPLAPVAWLGMWRLLSQRSDAAAS